MSQTKQQMETYTRSEQSQKVPQGRKIQNGDTRNDPVLPIDRAVGHVHRFHIPTSTYQYKTNQENI